MLIGMEEPPPMVVVDRPWHVWNRQQIRTTAQGLIGVYDGRQLLPLGGDQDHSRVHEVTLREEDVQVVDGKCGAGELIQAAGGFD
jgi:hypothetical protein